MLGITLAVTWAGCGEKPKRQEQAKLPEKARVSFAVPKEQPVKVRLIARHNGYPSNKGTDVGVLFEIKEGWHIYGKDPGDAGIPTSVALSSLPGVQWSEIQWPPAQAFVDPGDIRTFGYEKQLLLASALSYVADESVPELPIHAEVKWLACKEICLPGEATLHLLLAVGGEAFPSPDAEYFEPEK